MMFTGDLTNANFFGETINRMIISNVNQTTKGNSINERQSRDIAFRQIIYHCILFRYTGKLRELRFVLYVGYMLASYW